MDPDYGDLGAVARNLVALLPTGFSATTQPTDTDATAELDRFRARVRQLLKTQLTGGLPDLLSDAGQLASQAVEAGTTA